MLFFWSDLGDRIFRRRRFGDSAVTGFRLLPRRLLDRPVRVWLGGRLSLLRGRIWFWRGRLRFWRSRDWRRAVWLTSRRCVAAAHEFGGAAAGVVERHRRPGFR
jgi:hypothetical protein